MDAQPTPQRRFPWRATSWRARLAPGLVVIVVVGAVGVVTALQPAVADTFGYALAARSGGQRLPRHFTYQGVTYADPPLCADGSDCQTTGPSRWSQTYLQNNGSWPLRQVAALPTLFGAAHPVYEPVNDPSMLGAGGPYVSDAHPWLLFVADPNSPGWYYMYQRPGGP